MRTTFSVVNNNYISRAGLDKIRSGDVFSIKIIENKNGLIKAVIKGKTITLKGSQHLKSDTIIKVRAEWKGKSLVLNRINQKSSFNKWINDYGIKNNPAAMNLFEAVKRSGGQLGDDNLRLFKRLLRNKKELNKEESRTAAELIKKGLSAEEMLSITGTFNPNEERNNEKALLFNHLTNLDELWFIVPYSFKIDDTGCDTRLNGSIRIKKNIKSKEILSVVIDVMALDSRYFFFINKFNSKKRSLKLFTGGKIPQSHKKRIKQILPEILGNLLIKFDDNVIEDCFNDVSKGFCFDGFSVTESTLSGVEEVI